MDVYLSNPKIVSFGLTYNLIKKDDVITWVDEQIRQQADPDYFLLELSFMANKPVSEIISFIDSRAAELDRSLDRSAMLRIFELLYDRLRDGSIGAEAAFHSVTQFLHSDLLSSDEDAEMCGVDHDFEMVDLGVRSIDQARESLLEFLSKCKYGAMSFLEMLKQARDLITVEEGEQSPELAFLPGLSDDEISAFEAKLPCPMPDGMRAVLKYTVGLNTYSVEGLNFCGEPYELLDVFPYAVPIANDGTGNFWMIDFVSESQQWGPVFYVCHDPPVVVYQAATLEAFVKGLIKSANNPDTPISPLLCPLIDKVYEKNPHALSYAHCINSSDKSLREFAATLDKTYQIIDLRRPWLGQGISFKSAVKRHKEERIFAYQPRRSVFQRYLKPLLNRIFN